MSFFRWCLSRVAYFSKKGYLSEKNQFPNSQDEPLTIQFKSHSSIPQPTTQDNYINPSKSMTLSPTENHFSQLIDK